MISRKVPILFATLILATAPFLFLGAKPVSVYAQSDSEQNQMIKGHIASVQMGDDGKPAWIQSGIAVMRTNSNPAGDSGAQMMARFDMIKPDGTALHEHKVYDFVGGNISEDNGSRVVEGTVTVTMQEGPVSNVPIKIQMFGDALAGIWIGPEMVSGHFGEGPIYVVVHVHGQDKEGSNNGGMNTGETNTIKLDATEIDEIYRWSSNGVINPTIRMVANSDNVVQISNTTDEKHDLVFEMNGEEVATSGDVEAESSGQLTFKPTTTGTIEYHCEYHPDTMKGEIEVISQ